MSHFDKTPLSYLRPTKVLLMGPRQQHAPVLLEKYLARDGTIRLDLVDGLAVGNELVSLLVGHVFSRGH